MQWSVSNEGGGAKQKELKLIAIEVKQTLRLFVRQTHVSNTIVSYDLHEHIKSLK